MTAGELVQDAIRQSRGREPVVTAMVLLHGARVLTAVDSEAAKRAFAEGRRMAESRDYSSRPVALEAVRLGAGVDPMEAVALFRRLPGRDKIMRESIGRDLVRSLAQDGLFETAVELLEDGSRPVGGAQFVVDLCPDPELQRRAMAAARQRSRANSGPWQRRMAEMDYRGLLWRQEQNRKPPDPRELRGWTGFGPHVGPPAAVPELMAKALAAFLEDKSPEWRNRAPVPFWPSRRAYGTAMYWAGKRQAMDAAPLLAQIPDTDLALLGSMHLAAGALGLDEYAGIFCAPSK
jgi:hypothetical protein